MFYIIKKCNSNHYNNIIGVMKRILKKLNIFETREIIEPIVPESPSNYYRHAIMSPMHRSSSDLIKDTIRPDVFKWCTCHIFLSQNNTYPSVCFQDCSTNPSNKHILDTRSEYIKKLKNYQK
jgi:hypothetical protein